MLKKIKNTLQQIRVIWELSKPITHERLMSLGFEYYNPEYVLTDLAIMSKPLKKGRKLFYYTNTSGFYVQIRCMQEIAELIYGPTEYGK